ncbi:MAG: polymer-forming cytoskeletal protein [Acidobacteria bacterium]|nr:polymer-forming cytoskeletal protein [Acidobacteriota bacterium]
MKGLLCAALCTAGLFGAAAPASDPGRPALELHEGAVARSQVVGLGRDVVIDGDAETDVVAVGGSVRVAGGVGGDVIALGGGVFLAPDSHVTGDVFALGGEVDMAPGSTLGGRSVSYPAVSSAFLTLIEGPSLGLPPLAPVVLTAKVALLVAWLLLTLIAFATSAPEVLATAESIRVEPLRDFWVGLTGLASLTLTALFLAAFAGPLVGFPLLALVVLILLLLKLWGMVALFFALGDALARRLGRRLLPLHAACLGLALLGVLKLVPQLGLWVWTVATLVALGASLTTKLGRREPWFVEAGSADGSP